MGELQVEVEFSQSASFILASVSESSLTLQ